MIVVLVRAVDGHLPPTWQALAGCNSVQPTRVETRRAHVDWAHVIAEPFVPTSDDLLGASTFVLGGLLLARDNKVGQLCSLRKTILEQEQDANTSGTRAVALNLLSVPVAFRSGRAH